MTTQQHKQLVNRLHLITIFLGATLALISYLVFLNIRTLGVDARGRCTGVCRSQNYPDGCVVDASTAPYGVYGNNFDKSSLTGLVYRNGTQTGSFAITATQSGKNYYFDVDIPSNLYTSPGTYTVKVKAGKAIDCSGSFTI